MRKTVIKASATGETGDRWIALRFVTYVYVLKYEDYRAKADRWKVILVLSNNGSFENIFETEAAAIKALELYVEGMSA
jgi:hypothetical protein